MSPFIRWSVSSGKPWEPKLDFKGDYNCWGHYPFTPKPFSFCLYMCLYVCVHTCVSMPVCVSFSCLESPQSLRELWKINTLRQLCLFIHLITHYHCITVPLISHHKAQIDTFVLFYHTGVWCNQLNLHLMHQMDLEFEHGCINNVAIWKRGVKVYSLSMSEESGCLVRWGPENTYSETAGTVWGSKDGNTCGLLRSHQPCWCEEICLKMEDTARFFLISSEQVPGKPGTCCRKSAGFCKCACASSCLLIKWGCAGGGGGCLPVWDSE